MVIQGKPETMIPEEETLKTQGKSFIEGEQQKSEIEQKTNSKTNQTEESQSMMSSENNSELLAQVVRSIIDPELSSLTSKISSLTSTVQQALAVSKENIDFTQRYQRNTVAVLQEENKKKDKLISGLLLVDILKPIAEICTRIERRIRRSMLDSEKKFLRDILEEITDTVKEEYDVVISQTPAGEARPENISKVDDTIGTGDESLKGKVAESISSSWVLNGKLIQKERVIAYRYDPMLSQENEIKKVIDESESEESTAKNDLINKEDSGIQDTPDIELSAPESVDNYTETEDDIIIKLEIGMEKTDEINAESNEEAITAEQSETAVERGEILGTVQETLI